MLPPPAEKLQNFFGVFLQFQIGVDTGAVQDPGINGAVRHCHTIASSIDNLITDNLIINIAWRVEPVKGKLRKELFPFFRVSGMIALR